MVKFLRTLNTYTHKFFLLIAELALAAMVLIVTMTVIMLYYGGERCLKMMRLTGRLPMTGLRTWWQFLPIPLCGFLMSFDSILFLTGVLKPSETLFTQQDTDYTDQVIHMDKQGHIIAPKSAQNQHDDTVDKEGRL